MKRNKSIVISYMHLRTLIGVLGILLPFVCVFGSLPYNGFVVQDSISMHYYTNMRDIFVGILIGVALFLMTYKGYERIDNVVTNLTGAFAIGIACFPCINPDWTEPVSLLLLPNSVTNIIHTLSALSFFSLLAANSIWIFTKSSRPVEKDSRKYRRNQLFVACGAAIFACIGILIPVTIFTSDAFRKESRITLVLEIVMLVAFGVSWLVKGGAILPDLKTSPEEVGADSPEN